MTIIDALAFWGSMSLGAWGLFWGACVAARTGDRINEALERRHWRTLHTRTCNEPACGGRVWERVTEKFNPDLGFVCDRSEVCPACRADGKQTVEFDISTCTVDDIKALDRDHLIAVGE